MPTLEELLEGYAAACRYPGVLDEAAVERSLRKYVQALGVRRDVQRLRRGWSVYDHPALLDSVSDILEMSAKTHRGFSMFSVALALMSPMCATIAARQAVSERAECDFRVARAAISSPEAFGVRISDSARRARDAYDASDAHIADAARHHPDAPAAGGALAAHRIPGGVQRFAGWCVQSGLWWTQYGCWETDLAILAAYYIGATEVNQPQVMRWSRPAYDAFLAGGWLLYWTRDTLYWAAKPAVRTERAPARLHCENGPALQSDIEDLYFWHGVLVPDFVVLAPQTVTAKHIRDEHNVEVRRVMIERMGTERFLAECGGKLLHACPDFCHPELELRLYGSEIPGDPERVRRDLRCTDPSTGRHYFLRVPPTIQRADQAKAWTFWFEDAANFRPEAET